MSGTLHTPCNLYSNTSLIIHKLTRTRKIPLTQNGDLVRKTDAPQVVAHNTGIVPGVPGHRVLHDQAPVAQPEVPQVPLRGRLPVLEPRDVGRRVALRLALEGDRVARRLHDGLGQHLLDELRGPLPPVGVLRVLGGGPGGRLVERVVGVVRQAVQPVVFVGVHGQGRGDQQEEKGDREQAHLSDFSFSRCICNKVSQITIEINKVVRR